MKNKSKVMFIILFVMFWCLMYVLVPGISVYAANVKAITLKKGKTYSYDLNGDKKKEKIKVAYRAKGKKRTIILYINEKAVYTKQVYGEPDLPVKIRLIDFNTADRYKEILIQKIDSSDTTSDFFAIRYMGKKKISVLKGMKKWKWQSKSKVGQMSYYRFYFASNTGKNKFYIHADTPYNNFYFGCYYVKVPVVVKNKKLQINNLPLYEISSYAGCNNYTYELKNSMTLYQSASIQSEEESYLYPGTEFKALEIKPASSGNSGALYAKVMTSAGESGWLYFPEYSKYNSGYLKEVPKWG